MKEKIIIFTDGSSRGNPGPGGWGAIVDTGDRIWELGGKEEMTTNNRMELTALLESLLFVEAKKLTGEIHVHIDSAYVLSGATVWMYGWHKNGWQTSTKESVLNQDLWKELFPIVYRMQSTKRLFFEKVKGHSGVLGNERADTIATSFALGERMILFSGAKEQYVALFKTENLSSLKQNNKGKKAYSYVSSIDNTIAIHQTWEECKKRVSGISGARYKKVFSKAEEEAVRKEFSS